MKEGGESIDGSDHGSRKQEPGRSQGRIRDHITAAAQNFIAIGYWLKCIRDGKLYEQDGYIGTVQIGRSRIRDQQKHGQSVHENE